MSDFPTDAEREAVTRAMHDTEDGGPADILDALAPHVADRERAAAARARREAADDLERKANDLIELADKWGGYYDGLRSGMQSMVQHLRDRAGALEAGEGRA